MLRHKGKIQQRSGSGRTTNLGQGPILGDANEGQALLEAQCALRALHNVHEIDVAISHFLHLRK